MVKRNCVPLIPALNPPESFISLVSDLKAEGFDHIIVVDDGSSEDHKWIFSELIEKYGCDVFVNARNMGQGRALKNGMNYYLNTYGSEYRGIIPFDCDGQHLVKDAVRLDDEMGRNDSALLLGARDFSQAGVPFKSRFGNRITRNVLKIFIGGNVTDTQTGLRGIPNRLAYEYLAVDGEHFEYNTAMLIESIKKKTPIREIPIETVYFDENRSTHFRAVTDSVLIYRLILSSFIKYTFVSLSSFVLDYGIFCLLTAVLSNAGDARKIWTATVIARIISSLYNYAMNRNVVFKSQKDAKKTFIGFFTLCILQMCCSALFVLALTRYAHWHPAAAKPVVDTLLFVISYQIQQRWIFR